VIFATAVGRAAAKPAGRAWLLTFLEEELAPYPGRGALVARMVIAPTIVMLITMVFRLPYGSQGAIYTFLISREGPRATARTAMTTIAAVSASTALTLVGSALSLGDPALRLLWVAAALFISCYAISAMSDYSTATGIGIVVGLTLSLWDQALPPEVKVQQTLWACAQTTIACLAVLGVELAWAANNMPNELGAALADRLAAAADYLGRAAEGQFTGEAGQRLARLATTGTSRLRQFLQRSAYASAQIEQLGALVALVGHVVDVAANLAAAGSAPSTRERARLRALRDRLEQIRADVLTDHLPPAPAATADLALVAVSDAVPLLPELEKAVSQIDDVTRAPGAESGYALRPSGNSRAGWLRADALSNPEHLKFALKASLAAGLCYVTYTAVKWPGLGTSAVTCLLTALTTIGASRQKQALRVGGAIAGGAVAVLAQVLILPYVDSIGGFTLLFVAATAAAAWVATSTPRLSYFGLQAALAFYVVHLQEFAMQTSLAVARDRVLGVLLGLLMMWLVFDRLWGSPAAAAMKREVVGFVRLLAQLMREPSLPEPRAALDRIRALRETIGAGFDAARALGDGVLFEFGPDREADLAWRRRFVALQPQFRLVFLTRVALVKYRLGLPGFHLPPCLAAAQADFDDELARRFDSVADQLEGRRASPDALPDRLARIEEAWRAHLAGSHSTSPPHVDAFLTLSRRMAMLSASVSEQMTTL
jgi:multidrug resistance protein MdtO